MKRAITLAILFFASTCFAQMYTVTDLGTLGGSASFAVGMNASGEVTGWARTTNDSAMHAFLYSNGKMTDLDNLGGILSLGLDINAAGQVVGEIRYAAWPPHYFLYGNNVTTDLGLSEGSVYLNDNGQVTGYANGMAFLYDSGTTTSLGSLGGRSYSSAINSSGQITGWSETLNNSEHAFLYSNGVMTDLGTLAGIGSYTFSYGYAINASGEVAGTSYITGNTANHAFLYSKGVMTDLGTLGGNNSGSETINSAGQVIGDAQTANGSYHGFLYDHGKMTDLGTFGGDYCPPDPIASSSSQVAALNSYGEVTGASLTATCVPHAYLYVSGSGMHDLNELISPNSGWVLWLGVKVNDNGQVAGIGYINGQMHGFLLTPIYKAFVQQPINGDSSSVFSAKRGVIPVKFAVRQYGSQPSCTLPATIGIVRAGNGTLAAVDESTYSMSADNGSNFRIDSTACQYIYNLAASSLGVGTYRVDISISGIMVGHAVFALK